MATQYRLRLGQRSCIWLPIWVALISSCATTAPTQPTSANHTGAPTISCHRSALLEDPYYVLLECEFINDSEDWQTIEITSVSFPHADAKLTRREQVHELWTTRFQPRTPESSLAQAFGDLILFDDPALGDDRIASLSLPGGVTTGSPEKRSFRIAPGLFVKRYLLVQLPGPVRMPQWLRACYRGARPSCQTVALERPATDARSPARPNL